jgi:hypothetical protein
MKHIETTNIKELSIKKVFSYILGALLVAFIIVTGLESFKLGLIIIGILFFALAALVLVPHHFLRVTPALKIAIIVILYIGLAAMSNPGGVNTKEQVYENSELDQTINLTFGDDNFSIVIHQVQEKTQIRVSEKGAEKDVTTSGYFLIITGEIVNQGSEPVNFPFGSLFADVPVLKDSQNRSYSVYGSDIATGQLQPGVSKEFSYFYEIPKDALELKLIIKDKTDIDKSVDLKR